IATMAPLDEDVPGNAMIDTLRGAVDLANQQIRDAVEANPAMEGMGTTLTAMLFSGSKLGMVHIGDSRAYVLRDGEFAQVTKDDTYVQMLVDEGRISLEEANSHPQRSLLTRALDGRDADPEYSVRQVKTGDRYLLCSDGLSGVVRDDRDEDDERARRHPLRTVLILVVLLGLLGGGLWYAWSVTQSRFYIGATDDGNVAIFKGVPGKIAWVDLSKVYEKSDLRLDEL